MMYFLLFTLNYLIKYLLSLKNNVQDKQLSVANTKNTFLNEYQHINLKRIPNKRLSIFIYVIRNIKFYGKLEE